MRSVTTKKRTLEVRTRIAGVVALSLIACGVAVSAHQAKRTGLTVPLFAIDGAPDAKAAIMPEPAVIENASFAPEVSEIDNATEEPVADSTAHETDLRIRYFDGRPCRPVKTIWMTVTAYSPDHRSCGKWADGYTASMKSVWTNAMKLVAADPKVLPIGSIVSVPGYSSDEIVPVLDVGGAIKGSRLDVLYPSHSIALRWGVQKLPVTVWEYADE